MAVTITKSPIGPESLGRRKFAYYDVTFDNAYNNPEPITAAKLAARTIEGVRQIRSNAAGAGYQVSWNRSLDGLVVSRSNQVQNYVPGGGDVKGSTNSTSPNADSGAAPVNDALFLARTTFTTLAGTMTPSAQPDVARNVMVTITNDSGGALDLFEGVTTFAIVGTDINGAALTESVTLTSTSGNKSVANNQFRFVQGVKPFKTVTSVTITNAPAGALKGSLGPGSRVGLPVPLETPAVADVLSITVSAAAITPTATVTSAGGVDTTNSAINVGTIADGADVAVTYRDNGLMPTGTDLSGVTMQLCFECT